MPTTPISLPVLSADGPLRLTPTDVSQFVRLEQCERFLRFRLSERGGQKFMEQYDVNPQRITPLLTLSGREFEDAIEEKLNGRAPTINAEASGAHDRPANNRDVADQARQLGPGKVLLLFQPRLSTELAGWSIRGDLDLVRLHRTEDGVLHVLIVDMKSTIRAKIEHRHGGSKNLLRLIKQFS